MMFSPSSDTTGPQDSQLNPVALSELKMCSEPLISACLFEADSQSSPLLATPLGLTRSHSAPPLSGNNECCEGTFVAYALDTKFIADFYKERISPELYTDLLDAPVRRYLGLITSLGDHDAKELVINFVGKNKPPVLDELYLPISDSDADVGLPLRTNLLFPYKGLFLWTTCGTRVRTTQLQGTPSRPLDSPSELQGCSPNSVVLALDERQRLEQQITSDLAELEAAYLHNSPDIAQLVALTPPEPGSTIPVQVWCDIRCVDDPELHDPLHIIEDVRTVKNLLETEVEMQ